MLLGAEPELVAPFHHNIKKKKFPTLKEGEKSLPTQKAGKNLCPGRAPLSCYATVYVFMHTIRTVIIIRTIRPSSLGVKRMGDACGKLLYLDGGTKFIDVSHKKEKELDVDNLNFLGMS